MGHNSKIVRIHDSLADELEAYRRNLCLTYGREVTTVEASRELSKIVRGGKNAVKTTFGVFS